MTDDGYKAVITPRADGGWAVEVWAPGMTPSAIARNLQLNINKVSRIVRTEARARRIAVRMIARCEKRYAAAYDRDSFTITGEDRP